MEMIAHCVAMLVLALVQKCHDACIIDLCHKQALPLPLCFSPVAYTHPRPSRCIFFPLGRFSLQWPLISSCTTCSCYTESRVTPSIKHESVFMTLSCGFNEAHFQRSRGKKWLGKKDGYIFFNLNKLSPISNIIQNKRVSFLHMKQHMWFHDVCI